MMLHYLNSNDGIHEERGGNMDFALDDIQEEFKNTSHKFFEEKCTVENLRKFEASENKFSPELYKELAEMGFLGLVIPEEYGGFGGRLMDLSIVVEEAGRAALPSPFLPTITYGALPILKYGSEEQKNELLPLIVEGNLIFSGAISESQAHYDLKYVTAYAEKNKAGEYSLSGTKLFVPYADSAQYLLTLARTSEVTSNGSEGLSLFLVNRDQPGIKTTPMDAIGTDGLFEVTFENAALNEADMLGQVGQGLELTDHIIQTAVALQCIEMEGVLRRALEVTNEYVKDRMQFGRPIGSFQSVQHRLGDMFTVVEGGSLAAYQAIWRLEEGIPADNEVAIAKSWLGKEGQQVLTGAHQLHGGMGIDMDYPLQFCFRRFKSMQLNLGPASLHLKKIGKSLSSQEQAAKIHSS